MRRLLLLCLTCLFAAPVFAADPCPLLRSQTGATDTATRIAAVACKENQDWYRTFIDENGRSGGVPVYEAENSRLADGTEAWRKVAGYWNGSGVLGSVNSRAGAGECAYAATMPYPSPACRSFLIDTPWSAAFVSWVMVQAGLPGFLRSASHVDYVRQAYRDPAQSPYRIQAPASGKPAPGDLLCYVRMPSRIFGYGDLANLLSLPEGSGLAMHCDIVVGALLGDRAYLVGGNVQQAVTLRMLKLDARGYFADLPARTLADPECSPNMPEYCNANRQDWAVMLKLRPANELAQLAPPMPPPGAPAQPAAPQRCVEVAGGMQVCSSRTDAPAGMSPSQ
ncbi:MAG: DUF2272 domain-containing protein [Pseudoxanthomonas sp.]